MDRDTGERVILRGFGLGGWLLPEGYMWGIRKLDRPRQFERAVTELVGPEAAAEFWQTYYENFLTEADIAAMKAWGVNSVRVALLASMLQPRDNQPDRPPYRYSEQSFQLLDRLVDWCERHDVGLIWDLHGAPGAQNAENISDSDGVARLWTEPDKYWPRCIDLWLTIVRRYAERDCIIGYDLLNEPLLKRYEGVDPALLRRLYVRLTEEIRKVDQDGIIFVEGDEWAQDFSMLEPLDWDPHLVLAFHSYPPTTTAEGLARWDRLRQKYNVPLWHGETGERGPPYIANRVSTEFLEARNVGWSWWTHKKLDRDTQPWLCPRTDGFNQILDYWRDRGPRPSRADATAWLLEQARLSHSDHCVFIPELVRSLHGLDPSAYLATQPAVAPRVIRSPASATIEEGGAVEFTALFSGRPLEYRWHRDGRPDSDADSNRLTLRNLALSDSGARVALHASNAKGAARSAEAVLTVRPFSGPRVGRTATPPRIDGQVDELWQTAVRLPLDHIVLRRGSTPPDMEATVRMCWDSVGLYFLIDVKDDVRSADADADFEKDSVEIFVDCDNSKSDTYGVGDFRLRYAWNSVEITAPFGSVAAPLAAAQAETANGYLMELALPWAALGAMPTANQFLGLDIHVNDNDGQGRVLKRAWHARRDNAHLSPLRLGIVRLVDDR